MEAPKPQEALERVGAALAPMESRLLNTPELAGEFQELFGSLTAAMGI